MSQPLVIFLSGDDWAARHQAVMVAVTAASLGDQVTLVLAHRPLQALLQGRFDEGAPPAAAGAGIPPLLETLGEARRELGLRLVACETTVRLAGLEVEVARAALDELEPLTSQLRRVQAGRALAF